MAAPIPGPFVPGSSGDKVYRKESKETEKMRPAKGVRLSTSAKESSAKTDALRPSLSQSSQTDTAKPGIIGRIFKSKPKEVTVTDKDLTRKESNGKGKIHLYSDGKTRVDFSEDERPLSDNNVKESLKRVAGDFGETGRTVQTDNLLIIRNGNPKLKGKPREQLRDFVHQIPDDIRSEMIKDLYQQIPEKWFAKHGMTKINREDTKTPLGAPPPEAARVLALFYQIKDDPHYQSLVKQSPKGEQAMWREKRDAVLEARLSLYTTRTTLVKSVPELGLDKNPHVSSNQIPPPEFSLENNRVVVTVKKDGADGTIYGRKQTHVKVDYDITCDPIQGIIQSHITITPKKK